MSHYEIIQDDVINWAKNYTGMPFMACFCDPPYHLTSITKRFGKPGSAPAKDRAGDGPFKRTSAGFMSQSWDGTDESGVGIAFRPETWAALSQHLHPGGFILAFAGTRGYHRMACAMEDSGLIIHPALIWVFLSGFCKATRIDTQIDSRKGNILTLTQEIKTYLNGAREKKGLSFKDVNEYVGGATNGGGLASSWMGDKQQNEIPALYQWEKLKTLLDLDSRYDEAITAYEREIIGQQTKARKNDSSIPLPTSGATEYQTWDLTAPATPLAQTWAGHRYGLQALKPALEFIAVAQVPYSGKPVDCITRTGAGAWNIEAGRIPGPAWKWGTQTDIKGGGYGSKRPSDGDIYAEDIESDPGGRWPANLLLDEAGAALLDAQSGEMQGGSFRRNNEIDRNAISTVAHNPRNPNRTDSVCSYGDSGGASRMFFRSDWSYETLEQLENADPLHYEPKVSTAERSAGLDEPNPHPTLKPISLTKYLAGLLLPPDAYAPRRLLVPFAGVGSEMIGAILAGWDEVTGIEKTPAYIPVAEKRLAWWSQWPGWGQTDVGKILDSLSEKQDEKQLSLFEA